MIPVAEQPEPADFDEKVRQPGVAWLSEQGLSTGPAPADFKWKAFWTKCLDQLHEAYGGICAFACVYIDQLSGARSADHFVPKSGAIEDAYEWSNYRLACGRMNSRKQECQEVLDPFALEPNTFLLDFVTGRIYPNPDKPADLRAQAQKTIDKLSLDDGLCRKHRLEAFNYYLQGKIDLDYLRTRISPFVCYELVRQELQQG